MNSNNIAALLCIGLLISACAGHQRTPQASKLSTPPPSQHIKLSDMQPTFLYLAAQDAIKDGQAMMASELLASLLKKDPDAINPRMQLIEILLKTNQYDQAQAHITSILQAPALTTAQRQNIELIQIRLHANNGQSDRAVQEIQAWVDTHPNHLAAYELQIKILGSQKRYDEALAAVAKAIKHTDIPDFRLLQAQLLIKQNHLKAARAALIRMQELAPGDDTPVLIMSSIAIKQGKASQAESLLQGFLHTHPDALRIALSLGKLYINENRPVEAILVYRDAARHSANNPDILRPLGMLYFHRKNYAEAEPVFRQLLTVMPDDRSRFYLAASLEALDKSVEARELYLHIKAHSPLATEAQLRLAAIAIMNDELNQAVKRLHDILEQDNKQISALLMLSTVRMNQNKFQQLLDETEHIIASPVLPSQLLFNRAVAFEHLKQYDAVETMLKRVLRTTPSHAEAMNFLGYTYAIQGIKLGKAEALIHRALILRPDSGYYLDSLAWVYYKQGNYKKAVDTQRKALAKTPDDSVMQEHFGDILWQHGDAHAARQAWQKAIELNSKHVQIIQQKIKHGLTAEQ